MFSVCVFCFVLILFFECQAAATFGTQSCYQSRRSPAVMLQLNQHLFVEFTWFGELNVTGESLSSVLVCSLQLSKPALSSSVQTFKIVFWISWNVCVCACVCFCRRSGEIFLSSSCLLNFKFCHFHSKCGSYPPESCLFSLIGNVGAFMGKFSINLTAETPVASQ